MAAGLVLNSPQSLAIRHSARKPPSVLTGPVCPSVFSASAVTDFTVPKGTAPSGERAVAVTSHVSGFHSRSRSSRHLSTWNPDSLLLEIQRPALRCGCECEFLNSSARRRLSLCQESPRHLFCSHWGSTEALTPAPRPLLEAQGDHFSSSSDLLASGWGIKMTPRSVPPPQAGLHKAGDLKGRRKERRKRKTTMCP